MASERAYGRVLFWSAVAWVAYLGILLALILAAIGSEGWLRYAFVGLAVLQAVSALSLVAGAKALARKIGAGKPDGGAQ